MNILILGTFLPREYEKKISDLSAAANQFQNNMMNALEKKNNVVAISHISVFDVKSSDIKFGEIHKENIYPFFPRIYGKGEIIRFRKKVWKLSKWADCVVTYNVVYPWLFLKHISRGKKRILVLADFTPPAEKRGLKKVYAFLMQREFKKYDKAVLLSQECRKFLSRDASYEVINGCVDWNNFADFDFPQLGNKIVISYTGVLNRTTGVDILLKAIELIPNKDVIFYLCGQCCELDDEIKKSSKNDKRIKYLGYISKEDYFKLLKISNILVNPRNMHLQENKYNFPSKILEYIASGRSIVSTKFSNYYVYSSYVNFCESNENDLAQTLIACIKEYKTTYKEIFVKNRKYASRISWEKMINSFID